MSKRPTAENATASGNKVKLGKGAGPLWVTDFDEDSARGFIQQLFAMSARDPEMPIIVYIDSYGGDVHALLAIIAAFEAVPNQLITVAMGKAMSAGAVLLACGDIRYASRHASIMLHEISAGTEGHIADINVEVKNVAALNEQVLTIVAEKCKLKDGVAGLKKFMEKDRDNYMTAEAAKKFGLVDNIGVPTLARKVSVEWGINVLPLTQPEAHKLKVSKVKKPKKTKEEKAAEKKTAAEAVPKPPETK